MRITKRRNYTTQTQHTTIHSFIQSQQKLHWQLLQILWKGSCKWMNEIEQVFMGKGYIHLITPGRPDDPDATLGTLFCIIVSCPFNPTSLVVIIISSILGIFLTGSSLVLHLFAQETNALTTLCTSECFLRRITNHRCITTRTGTPSTIGILIQLS